jgi:transposase
MALFWLSDEAWAAIEPHLPKKQPGARPTGDVGHPACAEGLLPLVRLPGGLRAVDDDLQPLQPLVALGFWPKLLDALVDAGAVTRSTAIDSTYVKAQRASLGAKGGVRRRRSAARAAAGRPRSTRSPTSSAVLMR